MKRFDKALLLIKSDLEEAAMLIESIEEYRLVTLNPLGYRPIQDIDEIHSRNRRKTDDPYIRATITTRNKDYKRWKNNTAERR